MKTIHLATENFSDSNLLGQGGFGPVYKVEQINMYMYCSHMVKICVEIEQSEILFQGVLNDGREVAIKRLSSCSDQGIEEFTNEVLLIVKLQHKNLVRLLGFCVEGDEKLLVYEYMPNSSLDLILFGMLSATLLSQLWIFV